MSLYEAEDIKKLPKLGAGAPEAWKTFLEFDKATFAEGAIPVKYKELMALAVALTTQCPYCLLIHKERAHKAGATREEISETTFIAAAMRAGAAITHGTHLVE
jgi:AhpD family alkylhydroperoxidase